MKGKESVPEPIIKYASVTISPTKKQILNELERRDSGVNEVLQAVQDSLKLKTQEFFSYDEVAQLLGVSKRQVQEWVSSGDLKTVALPGTERLRRVSRDMLRAFVHTAELRAGFRRPKGLDV